MAGKNPKVYPKNYRGDKGAQIYMRTTASPIDLIQTKYDTQTNWGDLIAMSMLQGSDGDPIVLRSTNSGVEWKYSSETNWNLLYAFSDLPGGQTMGLKAAGATSIQNSGTIEFQNINGVTWALSNGSMQFTHDLQYTSATSLISSNAMNTTERGNYLGTGQTSNYRHTSADSQIQFTSANSLFQYTSASSLHLHTSQSSLFRHTSADSQLQFISASSLHLHTSQSSLFRHTSADSQLQFTSANTLFLGTAATQSFMHTSASSGYTSTWFANSATTKFAGTGTTFNGANLSASMTFNSNGLNLSMSAAAPGGGGGFAIKGSGTYTQNTGTVEFSASNGMTFVMNNTGNQMTVTHDLQYTSNTSAITSNALHTSVSRIPWIAGSAASSVTNGGVLFQTGNGITFGLNGSTMTASHNAYSATSQFSASFFNTGQSNVQGIAGSAASTVTQGIVVFQTGNGLTFGLNGSTMTGSHNAYSATSQFSASFINTGQARIGQIAASNSSYTSGSIVLSGSTNLTVSYNGSSILMSVADAIPLGNSTYYQTSNLSNTFFVASQTTKFAGTGTTFNGANVSGSLTQNSNGIQMSLSVAAPGGGGVAIAGSNQTYTSGTVIFRGTNLTVNTSAGGQYIDLSVAAPGAAAENNWITLGGNVASNSSASGSTIEWIGGNNITLAGTNNSQVRIDADYKANYTQTYMTYQNRQLGASTHIAPGQNSLWLAPFRVQNYISASTILQMMTITGTFTSAATAQFGLTLDRVIYSQNATDTTRWDSLWSTQQTMNVWNSGTSSMSFAWNGYTTSSAATGNVASSLTGMRLLTANIGSVMTPGLYMFGMRMSTSSANYSALVRTYNPVFDNPVSVGKNYLGFATATSMGYNDGGVYSVTTGGIPSSVGFGQIRQFNDLMPYFKIGGI